MESEKYTDCMNVTDSESEQDDEVCSDSPDPELDEICSHTYPPLCPWCIGCTSSVPLSCENVASASPGLAYWSCPKISPCGHEHAWLKSFKDRCKEPKNDSVQCLICLGRQTCNLCRSNRPGTWPCFCTKWDSKGMPIPGTERKGPICLGPNKPFPGELLIGF